MKKNLTSLLACFTVVIFLLSSCSKEKGENPPPPKTNTEKITTGTWKFGSARWGTADGSSQVQACQRDNTVQFQGGGAGIADEKATKCDPADPQTIPFSWNFQTNETILFISIPLFTGGANTLTIVTLTEVELTVSQPYTIGGVTKALEITFVH